MIQSLYPSYHYPTNGCEESPTGTRREHENISHFKNMPTIKEPKQLTKIPAYKKVDKTGSNAIKASVYQKE